MITQAWTGGEAGALSVYTVNFMEASLKKNIYIVIWVLLNSIPYGQNKGFTKIYQQD